MRDEKLLDEIPDPLKKVLVINAILMFSFAFLYIGFLNIFLIIINWPALDRFYSGVFGGTSLILGIFALIVGNRKELKQITLFLELLIAWEIMILLINISNLMFTFTPLPIVVIWVNNAIFLGMSVINIYFLRKYRK